MTKEIICAAPGCAAPCLPSRVYCAEHQENPPPATYQDQPGESSIVIAPGEVMGKKIDIDGTRSVWVGRFAERTIITMVNSRGEKTNLAISKEARGALLQLLLEDCA